MKDQDKKCKPCQLENNEGVCDRKGCSNYCHQAPIPVEGWEKEYFERVIPLMVNVDHSPAIAFITSLLLSQRQALVEMCGELERGNAYLDGGTLQERDNYFYNLAIKDIIKIIKEG